jgi:CheY-like chemotaxis protein
MKEILVVDDDDCTLEAVAELLRDAGYATSTASTGDEALVRLRRSRPDLLILDLIMPQMDGWQLLARLYEDDELARLPKVVMTAWPTLVDLPEGVAILKKPFEWDALEHIVRKVCGIGVAKCVRPLEPEVLCAVPKVAYAR